VGQNGPEARCPIGQTEPGLAKVPTKEELSKYPRNEGSDKGGANTWSFAEVLPTKVSVAGIGLFFGADQFPHN